MTETQERSYALTIIKLAAELEQAKAVIEKLRCATDKAVAMVEVCGHTATCECCWCKMRETLRQTAEAAKAVHLKGQ